MTIIRTRLYYLSLAVPERLSSQIRIILDFWIFPAIKWFISICAALGLVRFPSQTLTTDTSGHTLQSGILSLFGEKSLASIKEKQPHKWAAVVGYSYGTVLAQQYAHRYPNSLEKLILAGPTSRHQVQSASDRSAKKSILDQMREKDRESLQKIYSAEIFRDYFAALSDDSAVNSLTDTVIKEFDRVYSLVEENFGSLRLFIYREIEESPNTSRSVYKVATTRDRSSSKCAKFECRGGCRGALATFTDKQRQTALIIADKTLRQRKLIAVDAKIAARIDQLLTEKVLVFSGNPVNETSFKAMIATDYCAVTNMIKTVIPAQSRGTGATPAMTDVTRSRQQDLFLSLFKDRCSVRNSDCSSPEGSKRAIML